MPNNRCEGDTQSFNEDARLAALKRHDILDSAYDPRFERIVKLAQTLCGVPIALVSLVDEDRQWFMAHRGVEVDETALNTSVCALAIRQTGLFQIGDLSQDARTANMSLVTGEPHIRFYAGVPLVMADGHAIGSLCAIDVVPRPDGLTPEQADALTLLAEQVVEMIEARGAIEHRDRALAAEETQRRLDDAEDRYHAIVDSAIDNAIIAMNAEGIVTSWSKGAERLFGWDEGEMLGQPADRFFTPEDCAAGIPDKEFRIARAEGRASDERWHLRKDGSRFFAHGAMTPLKGTERPGFVKAVRDVTAEHASRKALEAARLRAELVTDAARLGTFDYDLREGELTWDDGCRALFGLPPGAPVSYATAFLLGVHPDDREAADKAVAAAIDPKSNGNFEAVYRTIGIEDGVLRHVAARGQVFFEAGKAVQLIGTVQDVTEARLADEKRRELEQRLHFANRATNDAIWDWDLGRDHVSWNDAIERGYGHRLDQVEPTGAWWIGHIHPDDRARIDHSIYAVIDGNATDWTDDYRFRRADGSYADVRDRGFVLRDADGRPLRMIGAMYDQSERMSVERQLRHKASDLTDQVEAGTAEIKRLWEASPDLLVVMNADGIYQRTNPAWKTVLGYDPHELAGVPATALVIPDSINEAQDALAIAQAGPLRGFLTRQRHKDGGYRWISWAAAPDEDEIFAIGRDVTEARKAEEILRDTEDALRQSQKVEAVGQLTGGVAHDFNNLLTVIRGSVDLLRRPNLTQEKRDRYIDAIGDTAERATRLTSQLLAFARRQTLQPQVFDAAANVASLQDMLRTLLGSRIEAHYALAEAAPIKADPSQFDTAIVNMAVNARDAMDGEGTLTIGVKVVDTLPAIRNHPAVKGDYVAISIADTGTGIAADQIDRIFEPFFTTKGVGHGTGLGLSQVFGFAKQSTGDVAVDSTLGQGTTFTLYLPLVSPQADTDDTGTAKLEPLEEGSCILVVEDNQDVGEFATQALSELGHGSHWAKDADAALAELARHPDTYDLVFTDVVMPGRSGIELAEEIGKQYPDLPVVLTSGYSHILAEEGTKGRMLLRKPYSLEELSDVLSRAAHPQED